MTEWIMNGNTPDEQAVCLSLQTWLGRYGTACLDTCSPSVMGSLLAVAAYHQRLHHGSLDAADVAPYNHKAAQFMSYLERARIFVIATPDGRVSVHLSGGPTAGMVSASPRQGFQKIRELWASLWRGQKNEGDRPSQTIEVIRDGGTTIYQIQNLNIYLTAEVINQLNMNPHEVINHLHTQLEEDLRQLHPHKP